MACWYCATLSHKMSISLHRCFEYPNHNMESKVTAQKMSQMVPNTLNHCFPDFLKHLVLKIQITNVLFWACSGEQMFSTQFCGHHLHTFCFWRLSAPPKHRRRSLLPGCCKMLLKLIRVHQAHLLYHSSKKAHPAFPTKHVLNIDKSYPRSFLMGGDPTQRPGPIHFELQAV